jgi:DNA-binding NarL/FixJ family response regulator
VTEPRILVADADEPTRVGLRAALIKGGLDIVAEARDAQEALDLAGRTEPQLCVLSSTLPGGVLGLMRTLAGRHPGTRLVLLAEQPNAEELLAAVLAGAAGYLGRDISPGRLPSALRGVLQGEVALPRRYTEHLLEELRGRDAERTLVAARTGVRLTDREWEVLRLLADGRTTAEIATRLEVSQVTVRRHVSTLLRKLALPDRASAIRMLRGAGVS